VFAALLAPLDAAMGELRALWRAQPHAAPQHAGRWCTHAVAAAALMATVRRCKAYRPAEDPSRAMFRRMKSHLAGVLAFWATVHAAPDAAAARAAVASAATVRSLGDAERLLGDARRLAG
jgi:hypothetical protein